MSELIIKTDRLRLCPWRDDHRERFATLHADKEVMADLGGPIDRAKADAKLGKYIEAHETHGFGRWAVEDKEGRFLGYTGVMARVEKEPLGFHREIGWRFLPEAWGHGYATEAARAALKDAFTRLGLSEVLAYTGPDNRRSQAVIARLGLERDPARDFVLDLEGHANWHGLVWVARPA